GVADCAAVRRRGAHWRARSVERRSRQSDRLQGTLVAAEVEEGKDIPVGIGNLKAPQPLVYERQLLYERRTALAELVEERVGVQGVDIRVPTSPFVPGMVWLWKHVGQDRLEHDADT